MRPLTKNNVGYSNLFFHSPVILLYILKEKDWKQLNLTKVNLFLKPNCLVQIPCKSDYKQESY